MSTLTTSPRGGGEPDMTENPLWTLTAGELAELIRGGEVRARQVLDAHLDRIADVNGMVNAVPVLLAEEARAAADAIDAGHNDNDADLLGVPIVVKLNTAVAGQPTTSGCPALADAPAHADSWAVAALRRRGAIVLGLANAPEFSLRWHTDNPLYGATTNPIAPSRVAGGSSGGSAVAVATGMTPLAHGNDQGGSLRHPASCCGVVAIRPTAGLTPPDGAYASYTARLFGVEGVLSRTVADNWLGLRALIAGRPRGIPAPDIGAGQGTSRPRIGLITRPAGDVDPRVAAAVETAGAIFENAGAAVTHAEPPGIRDLEQTRGILVYNETRALWGRRRQLADPDTTMRSLAHMESYFPEAGLNDYLMALNRMTELTARWNEYAAGYDALVGPVATEPPFEIGMDTGEPHRAHQVIDSMRFVTAMSAVGSPVAVLPVARTELGPIGVQIVTPHWQESRCVRLARIIERALGRVEPTAPLPDAAALRTA